MFLAHQTSSIRLRLLVLQLRVAQETLVFVEAVLIAVRALLILQVRMTQPTTVLVPVVFLAPQTFRVAQLGWDTGACRLALFTRLRASGQQYAGNQQDGYD